jgi:hypothetical protein
VAGDFVTYDGLPSYGLMDVDPDGTPLTLLNLEPPRISDEQIRLDSIIPIGVPVTLESSSNLTVWNSVLTTTSATNRVEFLDPVPMGNSSRFYRLRR